MFGIVLEKLGGDDFSPDIANRSQDVSNKSRIDTESDKQNESKPPMPILPKVSTFRYPPKCLLENVAFTILKKLTLYQTESTAKMGEGYDQVESGSQYRK